MVGDETATSGLSEEEEQRRSEEYGVLVGIREAVKKEHGGAEILGFKKMAADLDGGDKTEFIAAEIKSNPISSPQNASTHRFPKTCNVVHSIQFSFLFRLSASMDNLWIKI